MGLRARRWTKQIGSSGQARYLLALIAKYAGRRDEALKLMKDAVEALPDFLQPRYELRGDAIDPLTANTTH